VAAIHPIKTITTRLAMASAIQLDFRLMQPR
jgi:hypothetical protein